MSRILFLLVPGVHLLDLAGPAQVFSTAADFGHDYTLGYVAEQSVVTSAQGVPLQADTDWPELVQDDLLLVPGWRSPSLQLESALGPDPLRRLREHHAAGGHLRIGENFVEGANRGARNIDSVQELHPFVAVALAQGCFQNGD